MNLPNKLTIFRVILIVPFVILLLGSANGWGWFTAIFGGIMEYIDYIAVAIFIIASFTDMLDGKIARKYNLVTNFGKFMDPLADKLLVCSALICLVEMGRLPAWIVIIIIAREFLISGFRLVATGKGVVIAASWLGKIKTITQAVALVLVMLSTPIRAWLGFQLDAIVVWISVFFTVISAVDYIRKNINCINFDQI